MERIKTLLHKLTEIELTSHNKQQLLHIAEMLVAELRQSPVTTQHNVTVQMPYIPMVLEKIETQPQVADVFSLPKENKIEFNKIIDTLPSNNNQKIMYELNESIIDVEENFNEKLKEEKPEVAHIIKEAPVKDLRKAIGVNDKYLFINELFKGDEAFYEKCIKTINHFSVYPEAEVWIKRELMIKMSWQETQEPVQLFNQMVRRRFS